MNVFFSIPYLIHVCMDDAISGFWKEWFLEGVASIKVWLLGGFIGCVENLVLDYRDPIDLMDGPSNMESGLCWYREGTNNKWISDLMDHLMVDLE